MVRNHNDREITVIIPVYNCKNYLRQAVKSVISQSYKAIKVLLIDDGSTDGSTVLCDKYQIRIKGLRLSIKKMVEYQRPEMQDWSIFS